MATRKRATKKTTKTAAKAKKTAARKAAPARRQKPRRQPESLRLKTLMPSYTVDDVEKSLRFYRDGLGFIVTDTWKKDGQVLGYMLKAGACELGIGQDDWEKGRDRKKGIGFRVYCETAQDVDAFAARVRKAGYQLAEDLKDMSWGARGFAVDDPDGFRISIYRMIPKKKK